MRHTQDLTSFPKKLQWWDVPRSTTPARYLKELLSNDETRSAVLTARNADKQTSLHLVIYTCCYAYLQAAEKQQVECQALLLAEPTVDINAFDYGNDTPLAVALSFSQYVYVVHSDA